MEEQKYFIPEISNLFVGYECERYSGQGSHIKTTPYDETFWKSYVITEDDFYSDREGNSEIIDIFQDLKENRLRVLYLTKEQIEADGWNETTKFNYRKNKEINCFYENSLLLIYKNVRCIFDGKCRCINEFRTIMKFLEI